MRINVVIPYSVYKYHYFSYAACSKGNILLALMKLNTIWAFHILKTDTGIYLWGDKPTGEPFSYQTVLIDASTKWSHDYFLSSCNMKFARLVAQWIWLKAYCPDYPIKKHYLDSDNGFTLLALIRIACPLELIWTFWNSCSYTKWTSRMND